MLHSCECESVLVYCIKSLSSVENLQGSSSASYSWELPLSRWLGESDFVKPLKKIAEEPEISCEKFLCSAHRVVKNNSSGIEV